MLTYSNANVNMLRCDVSRCNVNHVSMLTLALYTNVDGNVIGFASI